MDLFKIHSRLKDGQNPTNLANMALDTLLVWSNQADCVLKTDDMLVEELEPTNSLVADEATQQLGVKLMNMLQDGMVNFCNF